VAVLADMPPPELLAEYRRRINVAGKRRGAKERIMKHIKPHGQEEKEDGHKN